MEAAVSSCPSCVCFSSSFRRRNTSIISYYFCRNVGKRRQQQRTMLHLSNNSFFMNSAKLMVSLCNSRKRQRQRQRQKKQLQHFIVVDELGGQYDDTFNDVKKELVSYFTFKAVRTVLEQLYEMNPPQYMWFNNFVADNVPNNATRFLQTLVKERRELAERVMITRLTLYGRWIKKCDHGEIYNEISEENLKLMRERLLETIQWPSPSDDTTNSDKETD